MKINFCDLQRQYSLLRGDIDRNIQEVLESASFIGGKFVTELEESLSKFVGRKYAVGVSSGTDALLASLLAKNVGEGDLILTTPFTFIATAETIAFLGAKPIFLDIDESTFNIDVNELKRFVTDSKGENFFKQIKGLISVNLFGQCSDYDQLEKICGEEGWFLIEDACQSFGAEQASRKSGSFGDISVTSFFPSKPLGGYGDGGMVFTDDRETYERILLLRNHGQRKKYFHETIGLNLRLDSIQAAIVLAKFGAFGKELSEREMVAKLYTKNLEDLEKRGFLKLPKIHEKNKSVFAQYSILVEDRDELKQFLESEGIPIAIHYPLPLHLQPCFSDLKNSRGDFPNAEKISEKIMSLPFDPYKTEEEVRYVSGKINEFFSKNKNEE